jgi:phosphate transport system protein
MVKITTELEMFEELVFLMSEKVRRMHTWTTDILRTGDKEKALSIIELDEYVNHDEELINRRAFEVLALLAPLASDLRKVIVGIKIATDLERIGDYAKSIARYVIKNEPINEAYLPYVETINSSFLKFYDATMEVYRVKDVKKALELAKLDEEIDSTIAKLYNHLEKDNQDHEDRTNVVAFVSMLRNFERAGDHTKNILEHLIYEVTNQRYDFG